MVKPEPTAVQYTPQDYRDAPSGLGPLAAEWADKPHRLVYDLASEIERLREELAIANSRANRLEEELYG